MKQAVDTNKRNKLRQRGQALVEFVLILPTFLLLTLLVIDLSRAVYTYNTISDCARAGARFASVAGDPAWGDTEYTAAGNAAGSYTGVGGYVGTMTIVGQTARQLGILDPSLVTVQIATGGQPNLHMRVPISVRVDYPFQPIITYIVGDATISMSAQSEMFIQ